MNYSENKNSFIINIDQYNNTNLILYCIKNDIKSIKLLINNLKNNNNIIVESYINIKNYNKLSALYYACYNNNYEIVKILLENGAKSDRSDILLSSMCYNNYKNGLNNNILELILEYDEKYDWNIQIIDDISINYYPLYKLCNENNIDVMNLLMKYNKINRSNIVNMISNETFIQVLINKNYKEIIKILLENNIDEIIICEYLKNLVSCQQKLCDMYYNAFKNLLEYIILSDIKLKIKNFTIYREIMLKSINNDDIEMVKLLLDNNFYFSSKENSEIIEKLKNKISYSMKNTQVINYIICELSYIRSNTKSASKVN